MKIRQVYLSLLLLSALAPLAQVSASGGFSGSDICQYSCIDYNGAEKASTAIPPGCGASAAGVVYNNGRFMCEYTKTGTGEQVFLSAVSSPPTLQVIQVWFIRILYALWAFAGVFFTFIIIGIGVQYMFSFGNQVAVGEVVKKFQRFIIGFVLVFLSYPLLNTFFALLPISDSAGCFSNINMPGFQFFFATACTVQGLDYAKCIEANRCDSLDPNLKTTDQCYINCSSEANK